MLQQIRNFAVTGRVLHLGAHPDDENTQLIAYLSRGRGYDTAYLSITRGDGGQNLLGPELDEKLGVARTQELLAARRIDGGRQFFTRAVDFGFSKNPEETLSIWDHQQVLSDVVRVIRRFQPDVIITRFPIPPGSGGHGHHTASAILAVEAFKLADDPNAFPEQLRQGLKPWQPKRVVWNVFSFGRAYNGPLHGPTVKVDIGGEDPVTHESFGTIANRSRGMHKTQGLGGFSGRTASGPNVQTFMLLAGAPMEGDFMDGVDTTWSRVGAPAIGKSVDALTREFNPDNPSASVPAILAIREKLAQLPAGTIVDDKRAELDRILQECLGLEVLSDSRVQDIVPGETVPITASVKVAGSFPVQWATVQDGGKRIEVGRTLRRGGSDRQVVKYTVAGSAPVTEPYWLREQGTVGMYRVDDPTLIGLPLNPPDLPLRYTFEVGGQELTVADRLTFTEAGLSETPKHQPVAIVPRVVVDFDSGPQVFHPGKTEPVYVTLRASRPNVAGTAAIDVPAGWRTSPPQSFSIPAEGGTARLAFSVGAPAETMSAALGAHASVDGVEWKFESSTLHYSHIPIQLLQPPARKRVVSVDVATRGRTVGYVPGAGDDIPDALRQLGYTVVTLAGADLTPARLTGLDAVVLGVRAFNTRTDLVPNLPALFAFVEQGGTVVAQYNRPGPDLKTHDPAPYPLTLSADRVTDERAAVTFLAPDHPALNTPNRITAVDFDGWVQERGIYYPSKWDEHFVPLLSMHDPGERPLQGGLLIAPYGRGYYVYTGLDFFRELPAGVPGAYRLFANLISLGK